MEVMEQALQKAMEADSMANADLIIATQRSAQESFNKLFSNLASDPEKWMKASLDLAEDYLEIWKYASDKMLGEDAKPPVPANDDKRFADESWQSHPFYDLLRQTYTATSNWLDELAENSSALNAAEARKLLFYTRQLTDALSPSNYLLTNPAAMRETLQSNGENLVRGMENMLHDMQRGALSNTDLTAFEIGKDLATTKGAVVYQNDLMQLIQYAPSTKKVHKTPLFIVAPWINKYYILDLRPENSFVKWLVDQGHTVFITSWVNPDASLADKGFDDYLKEGVLDGITQIAKITGEKSLNLIGYCLGGTLAASALAHLQAKGKADCITSATFLTTLLDFSQPGDLGVFIDDAMLDEMEQHLQKTGVFDGKHMGMIFAMLRSRDLIWSSVVQNYLLGKEPFPFDLLFWNADTTALPAKMHSFYLRQMYGNNALATPGGLSLCGTPIDLSTITAPSYFLSAKEDHIVPWQASFIGSRLSDADSRFVLAGSGHVAGVVAPPAKAKYGYWTNDKEAKTPQSWLKAATHNDGSWWQDWQQWVAPHAGKKVDARAIKKPIEPAPGSYVKKRG